MNTETAPTEYLTLRARGTFTAMEIPPRCRKPRPVTHETTAVSSVPIVRPEQAPAAFRLRDHSGRGRAEEIRAHAGHLYARYAHHDGTPRELDTYLNTERYCPWGPADSALTYQMSFDAWAGRFLIIRGDDGAEIWEMTGEPRYLVTTFGLGGNHGGTALMVETRDSATQRADSYFRADDFEAARAHAEQVALHRGDTESVADFRQDIEVLIPEAVTLQTVAPTPLEVEELRWDYREAANRLHAYATSPGHEAPAFAELVRLRQAIIATGHPVAPEDTRPVEPRQPAPAHPQD